MARVMGIFKPTVNHKRNTLLSKLVQYQRKCWRIAFNHVCTFGCLQMSHKMSIKRQINTSPLFKHKMMMMIIAIKLSQLKFSGADVNVQVSQPCLLLSLFNLV